jgi:hypothetical protein
MLEGVAVISTSLEDFEVEIGASSPEHVEEKISEIAQELRFAVAKLRLKGSFGGDETLEL